MLLEYKGPRIVIQTKLLSLVHDSRQQRAIENRKKKPRSQTRYALRRANNIGLSFSDHGLKRKKARKGPALSGLSAIIKNLTKRENANKHKQTRRLAAEHTAPTTGEKGAHNSRVPDLCCRDGLGPLHGFPGRPVPPDSGRIQSGIWCYLGGPETSGEGGVRGLIPERHTAEKRSRTSAARSCHATTAPRFSRSSEAAVSARRHSQTAAGNCGRVQVEISRRAAAKQARKLRRTGLRDIDSSQFTSTGCCNDKRH